MGAARAAGYWALYSLDTGEGSAAYGKGDVSTVVSAVVVGIGRPLPSWEKFGMLY